MPSGIPHGPNGENLVEQMRIIDVDGDPVVEHMHFFLVLAGRDEDACAAAYAQRLNTQRFAVIDCIACACSSCSRDSVQSCRGTGSDWSVSNTQR